ncbi:minor capsid protein [uncultured Dubosiella sp.]|uniref:minor capsid protein n=2 Tax=uncultured Dubosiella sp. TaxID=1937011 RepID=UPI00272F4A2B|nr:minor capsid protein [uncultured Dubosiella sp.]
MAARKSKNSADYWREREEEQRKRNIQDEKAYSKEIERIYRQMMDEIEVQINDFYTRYAIEEGITYAEAKKRVSRLEIERYAELAKMYVAEKKFSDQANEEMRLYNLTMKVNRLELLKANIGMHLVGGFDELQQFFEEKLTERTIDTFKRQAGILGYTVNDNAKAAHAIVNASFHNATWSDRIWKHQDTLKNELGSLLSTGLIQGRNPRELARTLRKKVKSSEYDANRLMITEMARVQTEAQRQSFEKNGFDQYTFQSLGTACPHCLAINGKHFDVKDMQPGVNAAPMHPNCRCSTSAYMERTDFGVSDEEVKMFDEWTETYDEHKLSWKDWTKKKKFDGLNIPSFGNPKSKKDVWQPGPVKFTTNEHPDVIEERLKNDYKIKVDKNIKKIPERYRAEMLAGYEDVLKAFPKAKGLVKKIIMEKVPQKNGGADMDVLMFTRVMRDVHINQNLALSAKNMESYFQKLPKGYLPVNVSLRGIASHEIGHCLESYILHKRDREYPGRYGDDAWYESIVAKEIVKEAYANIQSKQSLMEDRLAISKYSTTGYDETFAEAINDFFENGDEAQPISKAIFKIIEEELK